MPQDPSKATSELAEAIKAWLAERVSKHKRLEGGVHFIDAVPKNPVSPIIHRSRSLREYVVLTTIQSGKIQRKLLREQAALKDAKAKL